MKKQTKKQPVKLSATPVQSDVMEQIVILDTSVLAHDPLAFHSFKNTLVIIPIVVMEELDKIKKNYSEAAKNARVCIRNLDAILQDYSSENGVKLENNSVLKVDVSGYQAVGSDAEYGDSKILGCALSYHSKYKDKVKLLTRDINLRIKAKSLDILASGYERNSGLTHELYKGFQVIKDEELGSQLVEDGSIDLESFTAKTGSLPQPNEFVLFENEDGSGAGVGRRVRDKIKAVSSPSPWGLVLRNKEQMFLSDLIMDTSIPLVTVIGLAGSGKTLVSLASSLELVLNKRKYDSLIIYRPIESVGNELGFLPGSVEEKISPYYSALDDAFAYLFSDKSRKKDAWKDHLHQYLSNGTIRQEAIAFIRGKSIHNSIVLVDESQNLSAEDIKTIITRAGMGSKFIFIGDIEQIDNEKLDAINNGLTHIVEKFKDQSVAGHITLEKGERSELATVASKIL